MRKRYLHGVEDYVRFQSFYLGDDFYTFGPLNCRFTYHISAFGRNVDT
jgi:hypothetical protein